MRIRTIKPEFWTSRTVASLSVPARLTFIGLWNYADDYGRAIDDPRLIKAALWPLDDKATTGKVGGWLGELAAANLIVRYEHDGHPFLHVRSWEEHQSAAYRRGEPLHPAPPDVQAARQDVLEQGTGNREVEQGTGNMLAPRARDRTFEDLAEVCGIDWRNGLSKASRGALNGAAKELRDMGLGGHVRLIASNYARSFDSPLTPSALVKHAPALRNGPIPRGSGHAPSSAERMLQHAARLRGEGR